MCTEEIRSRLPMSKRAFEKLKGLLTARRLLIQLRKRLLAVIFEMQCYKAVKHEQSRMKERESTYIVLKCTFEEELLR